MFYDLFRLPGSYRTAKHPILNVPGNGEAFNLSNNLSNQHRTNGSERVIPAATSHEWGLLC